MSRATRLRVLERRRMGEQILTMPLDLPYKRLPPDVKTAAELTGNLFRMAMQLKYPQTMPRTDSRIWAAIQDQLDAGAVTLQISQDAAKWLKDVMQSQDLPPLWSSWRWTLLDALEAQNQNRNESVA